MDYNWERHENISKDNWGYDTQLHTPNYRKFSRSSGEKEIRKEKLDRIALELKLDWIRTQERDRLYKERR